MVVAAAAVIAAGVTFTVVMVVMVALDIGVIQEVPSQQSLHRSISRAGSAAEELDTSLAQSILGAHADAAAD